MKLARVWLAITALTSGVQGLEVTYPPYIQPGDAASFGPTDQMVVAWKRTWSMRSRCIQPAA